MAGPEEYTLDMELARESAFKDAVLQGAKQKAEAMVRRAEAKAKRELATARKACEEAEDGPATARAENATAREAGGTEYAARQELLQCRQELVEGLFADVRGELLEFVQSEKYPGWLKKQLEKYSALQNATVLLRPADMPLAEGLAGAISGATFEAADTFALGGCKVRAGARLYDETLDARLAAAADNFAARGAMRL